MDYDDDIDDDVPEMAPVEIKPPRLTEADMVRVRKITAALIKAAIIMGDIGVIPQLYTAGGGIMVS